MSAEQSKFNLKIESPYPKFTNRFDDGSESSFYDFRMKIPGEQNLVKLHRLLVANASQTLLKLLQCKVVKGACYDCQEHILEWKFGKEDDVVYRKVLIKWLKFCYGEDITLIPEECCAAIALLFQLQMSCINDVCPEIEKFMVKTTEEDVREGVSMMQWCIKYGECRKSESKENSIDVMIAQHLFTRKNIIDFTEILVDKCLMVLPPYFLDYVKYGVPHTKTSEFYIRKQYIECHKELKDNEKTEIIMKCDFTLLNSEELKQLRKLCLLSLDQLFTGFEQSNQRNETKLIKDVETHLNELQNIPSESTDLPIDERGVVPGPNFGGAIYDPKRQMIVSCNEKDISVTRLTSGTSTIPNALPFNTVGHYPVFDGVRYTYLFEGEGPSNKFGRFDMDSLAFEPLSPVPGTAFRANNSGCCSNGCIYIPMADNNIWEYEPHTMKWKSLGIALTVCSSRLMNDPNDRNIIYCEQGQSLISINLITKELTAICDSPFGKVFDGDNWFPYETYIIPTSQMGLYMFCCCNGQWQVYWSKKNTWTILKQWKPSLGHGHFVFDQNQKMILYEVEGNSNWEKASLKSLLPTEDQ